MANSEVAPAFTDALFCACECALAGAKLCLSVPLLTQVDMELGSSAVLRMNLISF